MRERLPDSEFKLAIISNCGPLDCYTIERVAARWPLCALWKPVWNKDSTRRRTPKWVNLFRAPWKALSWRINSRFYRVLYARQQRALVRHLYGSGGGAQIKEVERTQGVQEISAGEINSAATQELLHRIAPHVLLVSGGPILKPELYSIPTLVALNVHYGIAPEYRGEQTLFWAFYNRDFEKIGVTLHYINEKVDGGAILARGYPALNPHDNQITVTAKLAKLASSMVVEFLEYLQVHPGPPPKGLVMDSASGKLYRRTDRTILKDATMLIRHCLRPCTVPRREQRIERYF
ncbi:MAG: hypothetical protein GX589_01460 [Deltaproteobacteria bacterium]|nr:hypothetical protein [Deltaproteobacteria bacterium]